MKKIFILIIAISFSGCALILESMPGFTHTAALIIGESKDNVLSQAEHILIKPKNVLSIGNDTSTTDGSLKDVEIRRYIFTDVYDLVLFFYKNTFIQAGLMPPNSTEYPFIRDDYQSVKKGSAWPKGYLITSNSRTNSITTLE